MSIANLLPFKKWLPILIMASTSCFAQELNLVSNELATEQKIAALLLNDIYADAGLKENSKPLPPARANMLAVAGQVDGEVARIQSYADKNPSLLQVKPAYYYLETVAFTKNQLKVTDKQSLKPYRVGIVRGIVHAENAAEYAAKIEVVSNYEQLFRMLDAGRIDVAIDTGVNGAKMIRQLALKDIQPAATFARLELFHILHKKNETAAGVISKQITEMKSNGKLNKLIRKYEARVINSLD
jgi:hypothetical protein